MKTRHVDRQAWRLIALAPLAFGGCAGTHVRDVVNGAAPVSMAAPLTIALEVDNDSPPPRKERHEQRHEEDVSSERAALEKGLGELFRARGLTVVPPGAAADLDLKCRIMAVRSGNQVVRLLVGYGAGKAVLDLDVALVERRAAAPSVLLTFDTHSTTGAMPGGVSSGTVIKDVATGVSVPRSFFKGLTPETKKTLTEIDQQVGGYFKTQRWPYRSIAPHD